MRNNWRTLNLTPTLGMRAAGLAALVLRRPVARLATTAIMVDSWNHVIRRHRGGHWRNVAARNNSMRNQYVCHFYFAWFDSQWNLELHRPNVGLIRTVTARCNPAGTPR